MLPQLRQLERKYADSLAVVGVHSAKFHAEQATEAIKQALLRYGVEHPVVEAFVRTDALQCGFCTPGQIVSAAALVDAEPEPTPEHVRHAMAGNLCRCGAYPRIEEAVLTWRG